MAQKLTANAIAATQAERLYLAISWSDLSVAKVAQRSGLKRAFLDSVLGGRAELRPLDWCVLVAGVLSIDARWLALGIPSPAGAAARVRMLQLMSRGQMNERQKISLYCDSIAEPDKGAGVCRYCLCTDDLGCGNCEWVDPQEGATICSSCLEPGNT